MTNPAPASLTEVSIILRELAWTIHRKAPERAGVGPLPTTEIALLKQVIDVPGSTVGELALALGMQQPNASASLRALESRGFIARAKSARDRRMSLIYATPQGVEEHEAVARAWAEPVIAAIAQLSPSQQDSLRAAAEAMAAAHDVLRRPAGGPSA